MGFSEILKAILADRKLKQADLCRMTGIQTSLMSDYLSGKKSPAIANAILIADSLHMSLDALVGKAPIENKTAPCRTTTLDEICEAAQGLSEEQQMYILDTIEALKLRFNRNSLK